MKCCSCVPCHTFASPWRVFPFVLISLTWLLSFLFITLIDTPEPSFYYPAANTLSVLFNAMPRDIKVMLRRRFRILGLPPPSLLGTAKRLFSSKSRSPPHYTLHTTVVSSCPHGKQRHETSFSRKQLPKVTVLCDCAKKKTHYSEPARCPPRPPPPPPRPGFRADAWYASLLSPTQLIFIAINTGNALARRTIGWIVRLQFVYINGSFSTLFLNGIVCLTLLCLRWFVSFCVHVGWKGSVEVGCWW